MGVLPLQYENGQTAAGLGLTGREIFHIEGIRGALNSVAGRQATVRAVHVDGAAIEFTVKVRVDTPQEVEYFRAGGILPYVLEQLANA
jgi:aconitate hydratase